MNGFVKMLKPVAYRINGGAMVCIIKTAHSQFYMYRAAPLISYLTINTLNTQFQHFIT